MERCKRRRNTDPTDSTGKGYSVQFAPHAKIESLLVGDDNTLYTRNLVPGEALYGENLLSIQNDDGTEVEYRHWDPSRSKLAAAILCGAQNIWMIKPGSRILYVYWQEECGTTVSHISDLVGPSASSNKRKEVIASELKKLGLKVLFVVRWPTEEAGSVLNSLEVAKL